MHIVGGMTCKDVGNAMIIADGLVIVEVVEIPALQLSLKIHIGHVAVRVASTTTPYILLENSQRVATNVVSIVGSRMYNATSRHLLNATSINSTFALLIHIPSPLSFVFF